MKPKQKASFETIDQFIVRGGKIKKKGVAKWTKTRLMFSSRHFKPNKRTKGNQQKQGGIYEH